jgi:two-component system cell cycle response regulator CtrA
MLLLRVGKTMADSEESARKWRESGIDLEYCESGKEAIERLQLYNYDLMMVNLHLADMPGYEAIRMAREAGVATPCIVLGPFATPKITVKTLDLGADDFVIVPCTPEELVARVRAVIRRGSRSVDPVLRLGPVALDLNRRQVWVNGEILPISRREFSLMTVLLLKQGVVLSKSALMRHIYEGAEEPENKAIDVLVCRLRQKLIAAGVPDLIETVWGKGYMSRAPRAALPATSDTSIHAFALAA